MTGHRRGSDSREAAASGSDKMTAGADMQVLGIDAGGTKTVCYLADENGRLRGRAAPAART